MMEPTLDVLLRVNPVGVPTAERWPDHNGAQQVVALPRVWVLERIERVATETLDLADYWEYRRLLELADLLDAHLVQRLVLLGLANSDPDVQEAAEDFKANLAEHGFGAEPRSGL